MNTFPTPSHILYSEIKGLLLSVPFLGPFVSSSSSTHIHLKRKFWYELKDLKKILI